jgi:hypothetical protein
MRIWPCCLLVFVTTLQCSDLSAQTPERSKPGAKSEETIDFDRARQLMQKQRNGGKLTAEEEAFLRRAMEEFRKRNPNAGRGGNPPPAPRDSIGLKPLNEMTADDRYKGEDGGLYGGGRNEPPNRTAKRHWRN